MSDLILNRAAAVVGLIVAGLALIWFCVGIDKRISTLESQMQAVTITGALGQSSVSFAPRENSGPTKPSTVIQVNPIAQACADLARQMAEKNKDGAISAFDPYAITMQNLGCKAQSK